MLDILSKAYSNLNYELGMSLFCMPKVKGGKISCKFRLQPQEQDRTRLPSNQTLINLTRHLIIP